MGRTQQLGIDLLRVAAAGMMIIHGAARAWLGIVDDFGVFLSQYMPFGEAVAWGITVFEVAGGAAMVLGYCVRPISILFAIQLAVGIALVHAREGWFVVGAGRNGMEYSVLLIAVFLSLALIYWQRRR